MKDDYKEYIKWLALPKTKRKPRTLNSFKEDFHLSDEDLKAFRDRPSYQSDIAVATHRWAKDQVPEMLHKLYENALSSGKADVIKAYMDVIKEEDNEQNKLEDIISVTIFSDDQRKQIIERLAGRGGFDSPRSEKETANV